MDQQFLMDILSRISVSGCEEPVQETVKDYMKEYVDEVRTDEMGNAVCVLHPEHPVRIMLSAHADEIGLIVTRITAEGRIQAVERNHPWVLPGAESTDSNTKRRCLWCCGRMP